MDEKKVREAIKEFEIEKQTYEDMISYCKHFEPKNDCGRYEEKIAICKTAIEALEKQLPKKPIIKSEKEVPCTHSLGRLLRFHCPNCGRFIVGMYETDIERGGGISNRLKGCSTCLQAIDFSEYYSNVNKDKSNDEIQLYD